MATQRDNRPVRDHILCLPAKYMSLYRIVHHPSVPVVLFPMRDPAYLEVTAMKEWAEQDPNPSAEVVLRWTSLMLDFHKCAWERIIPCPPLINTPLNFEGVTQNDMDQWTFKRMQE
jgi:hypothetical protein